MIVQWYLTNFKAARQASLEFAPLTIFTGVNSAGKSTIIQSILLTVQTLRDPFPQYHVILNGPLVKLGEFQDVLSRGNTELRDAVAEDDQPDTEREDQPRTVTVGFRLAASYRQQDWSNNSERWQERGDDRALLECSYTFSDDTGNSDTRMVRLYPTLERTVITHSSPRPYRRSDRYGDDLVDDNERRNENYVQVPGGFWMDKEPVAEVVRANVDRIKSDMPSDFPKRMLDADMSAALTYVLLPIDYSVWSVLYPSSDESLTKTRSVFGHDLASASAVRFGTRLFHFLPKGSYRLFDNEVQEVHYGIENFPYFGQGLAREERQGTHPQIRTTPYPRRYPDQPEESERVPWFFSSPEVISDVLSVFDEMVRDVLSGRLVIGKSLFGTDEAVYIETDGSDNVPKQVAQPPAKTQVARFRQIAEAVERLRSDTNWSNLNSLMLLIHRSDADVFFEKKWLEHRDSVFAAFYRSRTPNYEIMAEPLEPFKQDYAVDHIEQFFTSRVRYLGPLRDEPRALYPISEMGGAQDVGLRGQYTAAVYYWHADQTITYVPSQEFDPPVSDEKPQTTILSLAVSDWLKYLGVADELTASNLDKLGFGMQVAADQNGSFFDLTQVGVGVSQVLPILVMCLLAPPGTTLILEQPELHLHPRVQTRLADFFASMIRLGKQCIIETHSEHLINRLRFRIAVSDEEALADDVLLYFVETNDGQAHYRPIRINQYGVIEDWPTGFFDDSHNLAADILRAGLAKRRRSTGRGG